MEKYMCGPCGYIYDPELGDPDGGIAPGTPLVPIELKPNATIGCIESECCGEPSVYCKENYTGNSCEITVTQKILIKIPVEFNVIACVGEEQISCGDDDPCC